MFHLCIKWQFSIKQMAVKTLNLLITPTGVSDWLQPFALIVCKSSKISDSTFYYQRLCKSLKLFLPSQCCSSEKSPQSFSPSQVQVCGMHCFVDTHSNWWVLHASPATKVKGCYLCKLLFQSCWKHIPKSSNFWSFLYHISNEKPYNYCKHNKSFHRKP